MLLRQSVNVAWDGPSQLVSLRTFGHETATRSACRSLQRSRHSGHASTGSALTLCCTASIGQPELSSLPITALRQPAKLAVFVSGGGSNFRAIHDGILRGHVNAEIAVSSFCSNAATPCAFIIWFLTHCSNAVTQAVISDVPGCGAWQYARQADIPLFCYPKPTKINLNLPVDSPQPLTTPELIHILKNQLQVQYVVLAGYLKVLPLCHYPLRLQYNRHYTTLVCTPSAAALR